MAESEASLKKKPPQILLLLCGLPGAGKTSFAKTLPKKSPEVLKEYEIQHICFDDILEGMADVFSTESWHESRAKCEALTCEVMKKQRMRPFLLILDDNFYYRSMRYTYFKLARKFGFSFMTLVFRVSAEDAIDRDAKRTASVGKDVIKRMCQRIEFPDTDRHKWDRSVQSIEWNIILAEPPVKPLPQVDPNALSESRRQTLTSLKHQVDLGLRKQVGATMRMLKDRKGINMKQASKLVNQLKSRIFSSVSKHVVESKDDINMEVEKLLIIFRVEIDRLFGS